MTGEAEPSDETGLLRRRAEAELARSSSAAAQPTSQPDLERLVHELQVHQIELELQNEELREARNSIEVGLARYVDLYDLAPIGYLTLDREGVIREANLTAASLLGVARAHLLGHRVTPLICGNTRPTFETFLQTIFAGPARCSCELMLATESNHLEYARLEAAPSTDGQTCRMVLLDITERKLAEQAQARLEDQLREARKLESIGQLAGGMAHDLNNLLTPIMGYSEMLLAETARVDPHYAELEEILHATQRARDLVQQLLAFGRKQLLALRLADLRQTLTEFERPLRSGLPADIRLHMRLPDALGKVRADVSQLLQVVTSLTTNAQEAMPRGGVLTLALADVLLKKTDLATHPEVTPGPYVLLTVSDDGLGMDAATQAHLFEPFFSTKGLGRGLGLPAVYGIVKQHGGHIWVTSAPGEGATWRIYLPRASDALEELGGHMAMTGVLVGLLCAMTWAGAAIMLRGLASKLDPFTLNAPRSLIGALCMLGLLLVTGKGSGFEAVTPAKLLLMLASIGIGGGIGDTCYIRSLKRIGVSRAFPLSSTYPALTLVFGILFLGDVLRLAVVGGLVLVLGGILLISRPSGTEVRVDPTAGGISGVGFALIASLCWATSMTLLAPGIRGVDSIVVSAIRVPALSLLLWVVVAARKTARKLLTLTRRDWWMLVLSGFVGWGLGSVLFVLTVALIGSARAAILTSTAPLFALPLSALLLRERIARTVWLGTALTVAGIVLVS